MSLSQCPQCSCTVSDTAETCPRCGYIIRVRTASGAYLSSSALACPYCYSKNVTRASRYGNRRWQEKYGFFGWLFGERAWKCGACGRKFD